MRPGPASAGKENDDIIVAVATPLHLQEHHKGVADEVLEFHKKLAGAFNVEHIDDILIRGEPIFTDMNPGMTKSLMTSMCDCSISYSQMSSKGQHLLGDVLANQDPMMELSTTLMEKSLHPKDKPTAGLWKTYLEYAHATINIHLPTGRAMTDYVRDQPAGWNRRVNGPWGKTKKCRELLANIGALCEQYESDFEKANADSKTMKPRFKCVHSFTYHMLKHAKPDLEYRKMCELVFATNPTDSREDESFRVRRSYELPYDSGYIFGVTVDAGEEFIKTCYYKSRGLNVTENVIVV